MQLTHVLASTGLAAATLCLTPEALADDVRFRGGVDGTFGGVFGSYDPAADIDIPFFTSPKVDYSGFLGGVNGRVGVQITDLIGVYAQPHLSGGSVTPSAEVAGFEVAGNAEGWLAFATSAIIDFTFIDRIFVGAGGGFAAHAPTCTNCEAAIGGLVHFRLGGYPWQDFGEDGERRMGLMVGADLMVNFLTFQGADTFVAVNRDLILVQPMLAIGYEAF